MNLEDFNVGDRVLYIPGHAHGDRHHPDCEVGVVTSKNDHFVFVRYNPLSINGVATDADDLVKL